MERSATTRARLLDHLPEYGMEALCLGLFMVSAAVFTTLIEAPGSRLHDLIADADLRRAAVGLAMGLTAMALVYSPWGRRSGAQMNPAVTLAFWRLGKMRGVDAIAYVAAQFVGGVSGVLLAQRLLGSAFTAAPVSWVATEPGPHGVGLALAAEFVISLLLMSAVLVVSASANYARYTGVVAGVLVALFISFEGPLSGMSMNPARSFASAAPAAHWTHLWIYFVAPLLGMQLAAHLRRGPSRTRGCAKLQHTEHERCIHCGFVPVAVKPANRSPALRSSP